MRGVSFLDLFSGIGATHEAFTQLEVEGVCKGELVNYCEWEEWIARAYSIIHNVDIEKNLGGYYKGRF